MQKYELLDIIDEGAYGIVYRVRNRDNSRIYAIKKFKDLSSNRTVEELINREIQMLKTLKSPYVVEMKEVFRKNNRTYIVFEYMGRNLLKLIEQGALKQHDVIRIAYHVFKSLDYLHSKNVMHRDIKPENILLEEDKVKLCDFGFARFMPSDGKPPTDYVATRWYRSPELLLAMDYGKAADIWALGCMICEMIDGRPLFAGNNELDQLYLIQKSMGHLTTQQNEYLKKKYQGMKFPPFSGQDTIKKKFSNKVGKKLISLIEACLRMDPHERITSQQALKLPIFDVIKQKQQSLANKHYNITGIYFSSSIQESLSQEISKKRGRSLIKLDRLKFESSDMKTIRLAPDAQKEKDERQKRVLKAYHVISSQLQPIHKKQNHQ